MSKKLISIFLSALFIVFIVTPTVVLIVDDSIDVSIAFSGAEEEEKGNEKNLDVEILFSNNIINDSDIISMSSENSLEYFFKKYPKPHLNLISPPPESNI